MIKVHSCPLVGHYLGKLILKRYTRCLYHCKRYTRMYNYTKKHKQYCCVRCSYSCTLYSKWFFHFACRHLSKQKFHFYSSLGSCIQRKASFRQRRVSTSHVVHRRNNKSKRDFKGPTTEVACSMYPEPLSRSVNDLSYCIYSQTCLWHLCKTTTLSIMGTSEFPQSAISSLFYLHIATICL